MQQISGRLGNMASNLPLSSSCLSPCVCSSHKQVSAKSSSTWDHGVSTVVVETVWHCPKTFLYKSINDLVLIGKWITCDGGKFWQVYGTKN